MAGNRVQWINFKGLEGGILAFLTFMHLPWLVKDVPHGMRCSNLSRLIAIGL